MAIVGAGVSGLTCAVLFAELGHETRIFAHETGQGTTSGAAAAIWFPYDAEPAERVIAWSLATLDVLRELAQESASGVDMVELRVFARSGTIEVPGWAYSLGARQLEEAHVPQGIFTSGYRVEVPVADTSIYLDYLAGRAARAGATVERAHSSSLTEIPEGWDLIVNCCGAGATTLVRDHNIEPHRGQVAMIAKQAIPYAVVCDDPPLMYAIPRRNDCVIGGTNDLSDDKNRRPRPPLGSLRKRHASLQSILQRYLRSGWAFGHSARSVFAWKWSNWAMAEV